MSALERRRKPGDPTAEPTKINKEIIRAVAVELNDLESLKMNAEKDAVKSAEIRLATGFSKFAEFVRANVRICKEAALTAFSLHPTKKRLDKLAELRAVTKKLNFLKIYYGQFEDMPRTERDEFWDFEVGYEECVTVAAENRIQLTTTHVSFMLSREDLNPIVLLEKLHKNWAEHFSPTKSGDNYVVESAPKSPAKADVVAELAETG